MIERVYRYTTPDGSGICGTHACMVECGYPVEHLVPIASMVSQGAEQIPARPKAPPPPIMPRLARKVRVYVVRSR